MPAIDADDIDAAGLEKYQEMIKNAEEREKRIDVYLKNQYWDVDRIDDLETLKKHYKETLNKLMSNK